MKKSTGGSPSCLPCAKME